MESGSVVARARAANRASSLRRQAPPVAAEVSSDDQGAVVTAQAQTQDQGGQVDAVVALNDVDNGDGDGEDGGAVTDGDATTDVSSVSSVEGESKAERKARMALKKARAKSAAKKQKTSQKTSKKAEKAKRSASKKSDKDTKKASKKSQKEERKTSKKADKASRRLSKSLSGKQIRMNRSSSRGDLSKAQAISQMISASRESGETKIKLVIPCGTDQPGELEARLECLLNYVLRDLGCFDEVILYQNTNETDDVAYLRSLSSLLPAETFKVMTPDTVIGGEEGLHAMYASLREPNTLYIKIDDDVVFVDEGSFQTLIDFALINKDRYTVFSGNTINNGPVDYVHQRKGVAIREHLIKEKEPYESLFHIDVARQVHAGFMRAYNSTDGAYNLDAYHMDDHVYLEHEKFALNVFAFFGDTFSDDDLYLMKKGDTKYITEILGKNKERALDKVAVVVGDTLFVHYSFPQQHHKKPKKDFDGDANILNNYRYIAGVGGDNAVSILDRLAPNNSIGTDAPAPDATAAS